MPTDWLPWPGKVNAMDISCAPGDVFVVRALWRWRALSQEPGLALALSKTFQAMPDGSEPRRGLPGLFGGAGNPCLPILEG